MRIINCFDNFLSNIVFGTDCLLFKKCDLFFDTHKQDCDHETSTITNMAGLPFFILFFFYLFIFIFIFYLFFFVCICHDDAVIKLILGREA